jgi:hypothetical protein
VLSDVINGTRPGSIQLRKGPAGTCLGTEKDPRQAVPGQKAATLVPFYVGGSDPVACTADHIWIDSRKDAPSVPVNRRIRVHASSSLATETRP